jgi:uncharacterized protein (TIGR02421 family)
VGQAPRKSDRQPQLAAVIADLEANQPVDVVLPDDGRLFIERRLPLICVYRHAAGDAVTEELLAHEPAYLIVPTAKRAALNTVKLLRGIVEHLCQHFGSCLVVEVWASLEERNVARAKLLNGNGQAQTPPFEVVTPASRIPRAAIEALSRSLGRDVLPYGGTRISLGEMETLAPPNERPLLRPRDCRDWNSFLLAVVARPDYRNAQGEAVPETLRLATRTLHNAFEKAAFAFIRQRKTLRPAHIHAPGRRSVVKSVLEIDRQLAEIDRSFDLLLQATPVNAESAWRDFRRSRFDKPPVFFYRPLAIDPALLKRQLYSIPLERIEDPTLAYLFRQKQDELDRQITLLADVDSPRFLQESLQVYGGVSDWLLQHAREVLDRVPTRSGDDSKGGQLTATEFANRAQAELGYYQERRNDFAAKVSVREDMYAGLMVSGDQLLIGGRTRIPRRRVEALLQHEIGTHLITRYNGHHQPFQQLEVGLAGYDGFQEGLAVLAEYLVGGLSRFRMRVLAARVVGAHHMLDGASFIDTFRALDRNHEFSQRTAYTIAMRLFRGGGLTKDAVYLRGLLQILRYLREGGELEPLFIGKVASSHLPFISELSMREIIKPPALRPRYLDSASARKKIERLRGGMKILELMR